MNRKTLLVIATALFCICFASHAQSRIHFNADYHYLLGISQKNGSYSSLHRSDMKMSGSSFRLAGMYSLNTRMDIGIGIGTECYEKPKITTFPIFASARYSPLKRTLSPYIYADAGYAFGTKISDRGILADLGIGYKHMFKKHFGIKFEVGYNMQHIQVDKENIIVFPTSNSVAPSKGASVFRHSISFGTGFIF